jgi:hypothetical protein
MIARGKREARRPWIEEKIKERALKVRNIIAIITLFQSFTVVYAWIQGRRASLCSALAPGYRIPRLWRSTDLISDF